MAANLTHLSSPLGEGRPAVSNQAELELQVLLWVTSL